MMSCRNALKPFVDSIHDSAFLIESNKGNEPDKRALRRHSSFLLDESKGERFDASGKFYPRYNFSNLELSNSVFSGAQLDLCFFTESLLQETNFRKSCLRRGHFEYADAKGSNFSKSDLGLARFTGANLSRCNFEDAEAVSAEFSGANMPNILARDSVFKDCSFYNTILDGADFSHSDLSRSRFVRIGAAVLNFSHCRLIGVELRNHDVRKFIFKDTDFSNGVFSGCDFSGQDLAGCNFSNCDVRHANFSNANLENVNFIGAKTKGIILDSARLNGTMLTASALKAS